MGGVIFNRKQDPPGPPFVSTAADNGLSVDPVTGRIVLGDDPGGILSQLLNNREIETQGNSVSLVQAGVNTTSLSAGSVNLFDVAGNIANLQLGSVEASLQLVGLSTWEMSMLAGTDPTIFSGGTPPGTFQIDHASPGNNRSSFIDFTQGNYYWGNLDSAIFPGLTVGVEAQNGAENSFRIIDSSNISFSYLNLDVMNNRYLVGDIGNSNNGLVMQLDDNSGECLISNTTTSAFININGTAGFTGTVAAPATITVDGGIVTNVA